MTAACPACSVVPTEIETPSPKTSMALSVPGMRCAACISAIENTLNRHPGVSDARVNFTLKRANIESDLEPEQLVAVLADAGYEAYPLDQTALGHEVDTVGRDLVLRLGVAGFAMMNVMLLSVAVWSGATDATRDMFHLISAAIALPAALFSAKPFFSSAASALSAGRLNMDVPISLAILLAGAISLFEALNGGSHAYFDAALSLTFFLLIGRVLEQRTRASARSAARELSALETHEALRKSGRSVDKVAASDLAPGDTVVVPTGVRVPVDGTLASPAAFTDRSFLTGESDPVHHATGKTLRAGEINLGPAFDLIATAVGEETKLRQMARLVEAAENVRNSYTSLADRVARFYAPAVHMLAAVTFAGWLWTTGDVRTSLNTAVAVLIITCPCALGLAVPAVATAAVGRLYRMGFLVKSGTALERLAEVDRIVFDKTGTLTKPGFSFELSSLSEDARAVAKALAQRSSHPLSVALNAYLGDTKPADIADLAEETGRGLRATWNGETVWLGRDQSPAHRGLVLKVGETATPLSYHESAVEGTEGLAGALQQTGMHPIILSGDQEGKTRRLADKLGFSDWMAGMSPDDKHHHIVELTKAGQQPCMVGDGINDTAALTAAHASVAPGSALDAARNAADVVILGGTLKYLPDLLEISRKSVRLSRQNFAIAFCYNAIAIPFAVAGFATPIAAALAMSASSICVLLNALRVR